MQSPGHGARKTAPRRALRDPPSIGRVIVSATRFRPAVRSCRTPSASLRTGRRRGTPLPATSVATTFAARPGLCNDGHLPRRAVRQLHAEAQLVADSQRRALRQQAHLHPGRSPDGPTPRHQRHERHPETRPTCAGPRVHPKPPESSPPSHRQERPDASAPSRDRSLQTNPRIPECSRAGASQSRARHLLSARINSRTTSYHTNDQGARCASSRTSRFR